MMNKEEIVNLLYIELGDIYCYNCRHQGEDCEDCHRKYMDWAIRKETCEQLAGRIVDE